MPRYACFSRYLAAKKSVDDRALNRHVWATLVEALAAQPAATQPLRVLELGAGIGTMIERVWDWGLLRTADYTALDELSTNRTVLAHRLRKRDWQPSAGDTAETVLERDGFVVRAQTAELFAALPALRARPRCDLLIAHAFLDLIDLPTGLPLLLDLIKPGGLGYFTLTFDGVTALEPALDPALDGLIERLYHADMDARVINGRPSGDSRSGRHLLTHLRAAGAAILAAGASDWVVTADPAGRYPGDEAYFLHFIVATIGRALRGQPELPPAVMARWLKQRHAQIDAGELIYIAHQLDVLVRAPDGSSGAV